MPLQDFDLSKDDTRLVKCNDTVYKVKILPRIPITSNLPCSSTVAHREIEDVLRALLYMDQRSVIFKPIHTEHFIITTLKKGWKTCRSLMFQSNGKEIKACPYQYILKVDLKDRNISNNANQTVSNRSQYNQQDSETNSPLICLSHDRSLGTAKDQKSNGTAKDRKSNETEIDRKGDTATCINRKSDQTEIDPKGDTAIKRKSNHTEIDPKEIVQTYKKVHSLTDVTAFNQSEDTIQNDDIVEKEEDGKARRNVLMDRIRKREKLKQEQTRKKDEVDKLFNDVGNSKSLGKRKRLYKAEVYCNTPGSAVGRKFFRDVLKSDKNATTAKTSIERRKSKRHFQVKVSEQDNENETQTNTVNLDDDTDAIRPASSSPKSETQSARSSRIIRCTDSSNSSRKTRSDRIAQHKLFRHKKQKSLSNYSLSTVSKRLRNRTIPQNDSDFCSTRRESLRNKKRKLSKFHQCSTSSFDKTSQKKEKDALLTRKENCSNKNGRNSKLHGSPSSSEFTKSPDSIPRISTQNEVDDNSTEQVSVEKRKTKFLRSYTQSSDSSSEYTKSPDMMHRTSPRKLKAVNVHLPEHESAENTKRSQLKCKTTLSLESKRSSDNSKRSSDNSKRSSDNSKRSSDNSKRNLINPVRSRSLSPQGKGKKRGSRQILQQNSDNENNNDNPSPKVDLFKAFRCSGISGKESERLENLKSLTVHDKNKRVTRQQMDRHKVETEEIEESMKLQNMSKSQTPPTSPRQSLRKRRRSVFWDFLDAFITPVKSVFKS